jgi:hypothetical protein
LVTFLFAPLFEWVLGADDPMTVMSRNKRAMGHLAAGRPARAIPLYKRTLADCERTLGANHQGTLRARNNLAMSYQAAGRTAEATSLLERTLADCERTLGADHLDTKTTRANLAALTSRSDRAHLGDA